jgi:hypothetical protein
VRCQSTRAAALRTRPFCTRFAPFRMRPLCASLQPAIPRLTKRRSGSKNQINSKLKKDRTMTQFTQSQHFKTSNNLGRSTPNPAEAHQKSGGKKSDLKRVELAKEALKNAVTGQSFANYQAIIAGFSERGIPAQDIAPRENVFTFNAWRALGRTVRKGEKGIAVLTWIECAANDKERQKTQDKQGESSTHKRAKTTYVFHISQTDSLAEIDTVAA